MEIALMNYFVLNDEIRSTCDFNPYPLKNGLSIYEVIRIQQGIPLFLEEHLDRFYSSALLENTNIPFESESIKHRLKALLDYNKILEGNIKFLFHINQDGESRFMAWLMPFYYPSAQQYQKGVTVEIMHAQRHRPNAKKALYRLREKADMFIKEKNCFEVAYCNPDGFITEGSRSNLFFIKAGNIITPELSLVLPGITRAKVMDLARENNLAVSEQKIKLDQLTGFDACFITGTSPKLLPVNCLHTTQYNVSHPVLHELMKAYDLLCKKYVKHFTW